MTRAWIVGIALLAQSFELTAAAGTQSLSLEEGIRRYWNGEYEATIGVLENACALGADGGERIECYKYLAFSHIALGADESAVREFTRLLSTDPRYRLDASLVSPKILVRFEQARQNLAKRFYADAKAAYHDAEFSRAVELLDDSLALDPENELAREYRELSKERSSLSAARTTTTTTTTIPPPAPVAEIENKVYRLTSDISRPVLVERFAPTYPRMARMRRVEGSVVISVVIDREGHVTQSKVIRSVDPELDRAALDAVAGWRYQPATLNGFPVAVYGIIELSFQLNRS